MERHTLKGDAKDWRKQGITTETALLGRVRQILEHPETTVILCAPKPDRGHPASGEVFGREIYVLQQWNAGRARTEDFVVALNPNTRNGEPIGGSSWVNDRSELPRLVRKEARESKREIGEIRVLRGGLPALKREETDKRLMTQTATRRR